MIVLALALVIVTSAVCAALYWLIAATRPVVGAGLAVLLLAGGTALVVALPDRPGPGYAVLAVGVAAAVITAVVHRPSGRRAAAGR